MACRGLKDNERDDSVLLSSPKGILKVEELKPQDINFNPMTEVLNASPRFGARIVVAAVPGRTTEWLQRIADCHIARTAELGYPSNRSASPLDVKGAAVSVSSRGNAFDLDVTSSDKKVGRDILKRAQALAPSPAPAVKP